MGKENAPEVLAQEILSDGRKRAERSLSAARAEAEKILSQARAKAELEAQRIRDAAAARAEQRSRMVLKTVDQEVARRKLAAREEVIHDAFEKARAQLDALGREDYYRAAAALAGDALRKMPGDRFTLVIAGLPAEDGRRLAEELAAGLRAEGRAAQLEFREGSGARGVSIQSPDGRLRWDDTFAARLRRLHPDLRRQVAPMLFEEL